MKRTTCLFAVSCMLLSSLSLFGVGVQRLQASSEHDVGIAQVIIDYTVTWSESPSMINVTVVNHGVYDETVNVTVYANSTVIQEICNVSLARGSYAVLTVLWDGSGVYYGKYVISAYVHPVENETETTDNTFVDGPMRVTMPYDVNGDGKINVLDLVLNAIYLGKPWPPFPIIPPPIPFQVDVNGDGGINVLDLILVAGSFGSIIQSLP